MRPDIMQKRWTMPFFPLISFLLEHIVHKGIWFVLLWKVIFKFLIPISRCNPHKQKLSGVFNPFVKCQGFLRPKTWKTRTLGQSTEKHTWNEVETIRAIRKRIKMWRQHWVQRPQHFSEFNFLNTKKNNETIITQSLTTHNKMLAFCSICF